MSSLFQYSIDNKRYRTMNAYLRQRFGGKVFKISLNGGFTCPNRDGTKGFGGCSYCSVSRSGDFAGDPRESIPAQFAGEKARMEKKWQGKYIAYFQAGTNTYAPLSQLKALYEEALAQEGVVGLSLSTRPDCLAEDVLDYLTELAGRTCLTVELGLQTVHDATAVRIRRGHTYRKFVEGYRRLRDRGILTGIHIINGLPGETPDMMLETARAVAELNPHSLKIHLLHVLEGTLLAEEYGRGEFPLLTLEEYVRIVCDQLELLPPEVVLQRLTGDGNRSTLIGPLWSLKKRTVLNEIDKELARRDTWQGIYRS